jgi:predicted phosphodiesterase
MRCSIIVLLAAAGCSTPNSGASDGGTGGSGGDAGVYKDAPLGDVGGGSLTELKFAVVGDTRPSSNDDTAGYPTAIITKIWQDVAAESPQFAISSGDYMFASANGSQGQPQLAKYMAARGAFSGLLYPALGNHECTGGTASNCGPGSQDGLTKNYSAFISTMLAPIGVSKPYYVEHFSAADQSWTAKFVFVACNAWSPTQSSWLSTALAESTTYTFVVRHESVDALSTTPTPPCGASQAIINAHPLTLLIVGHTHTYRHYASDKEIIVGNGGAPLTTGMNYGFVIVSRNASGTLTVTAYDYMTHAVLDTFTIQASGAAG